MNLGLGGKSALVTGGTHGIGLAIALALAEEGANVIIASRTRQRLVRAVGSFRGRTGKCLAMDFDALDPVQVECLASRAM